MMYRISSPSPGGGNAPVPAVQACSFELDVQWILDIIDKISEFLRNVGSAVNTALDSIGQVLEALAKIADWFAWVPGIGEMAKSAIRHACDIAGDAIEFTYNLHADVLQFTKNALAPWEIRSAGRQINEQIVPRAREFTQSLEPSNFTSNQSWQGQAAEKFRANVASQYDFATQLADGTEQFGAVVQQMGEEGVQSTIEFVVGFFKAAASLIQAIIKVWAVPVGTAVAVKDIINLVMAIIEMIQVWVEMVTAVVSQTMQMRSAAEAAAPTSEWPKIAS